LLPLQAGAELSSEGRLRGLALLNSSGAMNNKGGQQRSGPSA
jgi:hypothetical protein